MGVDLTWCADRMVSRSKCVLAMTDHETDMAWSKLLKRKEDMSQTDVKFTDELVGQGKGAPSFLRMGGASENEKMAESIKGSTPRLKWNTLLMARCNRMGSWKG